MLKAERIRGPDLERFGNTKLPFKEAIRAVDSCKRVIASNKRLSRALNSNEWSRIKDAFPCWSGTMVAYEEPDKGFGSIVSFQDPENGIRWIFPVPAEFAGEKNAALAVDHPDFSLLQDGKDMIIECESPDLIKGFPSRSRLWHLGDNIHDIPQGAGSNISLYGNKRTLWRTGRRVCPAIRNSRYGPGHESFNIILTGSLAVDLGIIVER